jgi:hypothetical protein
MKAIIAAVVFALIPVTAVAGGEDPSPEAAPDPVSSKEEILGSCLESQAGFTWVKTVEEYEEVRYSKPNHFYFGSKIWISRNSDIPKAKPCLQKIGAK